MLLPQGHVLFHYVMHIPPMSMGGNLEKMKLNERGRQTLGRQKPCKQAQHAKLYFDSPIWTDCPLSGRKQGESCVQEHKLHVLAIENQEYYRLTARNAFPYVEYISRLQDPNAEKLQFAGSTLNCIIIIEYELFCHLKRGSRRHLRICKVRIQYDIRTKLGLPLRPRESSEWAVWFEPRTHIYIYNNNTCTTSQSEFLKSVFCLANPTQIRQCSENIPQRTNILGLVLVSTHKETYLRWWSSNTSCSKRRLCTPLESWHFALLKVSKTGDPSGYSVDANWQVGSFRCGEWTMTADPISSPQSLHWRSGELAVASRESDILSLSPVALLPLQTIF